MKCKICKNKVNETFLKKVVGTYIKDKNGKKHLICVDCQKNYDNNKLKMLEHI
jgi:hypothetical protein